jgi:ATP-dependent protease ClpP protease subunit
VIVPNKSYRLNPDRAIYITGVINDELLTQLTPKILSLQHESRDPISVYIDSPGGSPSSMESILRLLHLTDQNQSDACDIITAVTARADSAAADLLSSGDYAIAFPSTKILHHGVRRVERNPLTFESTSQLSELMRFYKDVYAMQLAQKIENRFSFRFVTARQKFSALREKKASPDLSELDCFIEVIEEELSEDAKGLWTKAKDRHGRYHQLIDIVLEQTGSQIPSNPAQVQANVIKAIVDFEVASNGNNPSWNFRNGGISRLVDDFFLLEEYLTNTNHARLKDWCTSFGRWSLNADQTEEVNAIPDDDARLEKIIELVRPILQPVWTFFVALCHALQEGENELTAKDAYWLGLLDEVIGEDLYTIRNLMEYEDDPEEKEEEED